MVFVIYSFPNTLLGSNMTILSFLINGGTSDGLFPYFLEFRLIDADDELVANYNQVLVIPLLGAFRPVEAPR